MTVADLLATNMERLVLIADEGSEFLQEVRVFLEDIGVSALPETGSDGEPDRPPHVLVVWRKTRHSLASLILHRDKTKKRINQIDHEIMETENCLRAEQLALREQLNSSFTTERMLRRIMEFIETSSDLGAMDDRGS